MLRRIEGRTYNSPIKQFYCRRCKKSTNVIYKDENGESYCDLCVENREKSSTPIEEKVVEQKVEVQEIEETVDIPPRKTVKCRRKGRVTSAHRGERKLL